MKFDSPYVIELFYDGACPLCSREIIFIQRLDRKSKIKFTDISLEGFDPKRYGKELSTFMEIIQCRTVDGKWIEGVEAFRQIYSMIGFRPFVFFTRIPGVSHLLDLIYRTFAKNKSKTFYPVKSFRLRMKKLSKVAFIIKANGNAGICI